MMSYWEQKDMEREQQEYEWDMFDVAAQADAVELEEDLMYDFKMACEAPKTRFLEKIEAGRKVEYPLEYFLEDWGMGAFKDNILELFKRSSCIVAQQFKNECAKMYAQDNSLELARWEYEQGNGPEQGEVLF